MPGFRHRTPQTSAEWREHRDNLMAWRREVIANAAAEGWSVPPGILAQSFTAARIAQTMADELAARAVERFIAPTS